MFYTIDYCMSICYYERKTTDKEKIAMAKKEKRFQEVYSQEMGTVKIYVDKQTGVNYVYVAHGYGGGLTVLLDSEGKPVITKPEEF